MKRRLACSTSALYSDFTLLGNLRHLRKSWSCGRAVGKSGIVTAFGHRTARPRWGKFAVAWAGAEIAIEESRQLRVPRLNR